MIKKFDQFVNEDYVDKRTDTKSEEIIQKAVDKIRSLGYKNPFNNSTIINDRVTVEVSNFDGYLWLNSIMTLERGKGYASEVLQKICDIADEFQVTLVLTPVPFGKDKKEILTTSQLIKWYKKYGFVKYHIEDMKRQPKS